MIKKNSNVNLLKIYFLAQQKQTNKYTSKQTDNNKLKKSKKAHTHKKEISNCWKWICICYLLTISELQTNYLMCHLQKQFRVHRVITSWVTVTCSIYVERFVILIVKNQVECDELRVKKGRNCDEDKRNIWILYIFNIGPRVTQWVR